MLEAISKEKSLESYDEFIELCNSGEAQLNWNVVIAGASALIPAFGFLVYVFFRYMV